MKTLIFRLTIHDYSAHIEAATQCYFNKTDMWSKKKLQFEISVSLFPVNLDTIS